MRLRFRGTATTNINTSENDEPTSSRPMEEILDRLLVGVGHHPREGAGELVAAAVLRDSVQYVRTALRARQ